MTGRTPHSATLVAAAALALPLGTASPQSLRGSHASVERMHRQAVRHHLTFYQTPAGVRRAAARGTLVRLSANANYALGAVGYPYVRKSTRTFVSRLGAQYRRACGEQLVVTGAVRPATRQPWNASDRSVHPTGMAVDLRKPRNTRCRGWLRRTLLSLERAGVIEATEEFGPPHFHVAVYPTQYTQYVRRLTTSATLAHGGGGHASPTYVVRAGDTLWGISRRYDTTVGELMSANGLDDAAIKPGQTLKVPGGGG
jgi:nucleoid-associated protein YgaU